MHWLFCFPLYMTTRCFTAFKGNSKKELMWALNLKGLLKYPMICISRCAGQLCSCHKSRHRYPEKYRRYVFKDGGVQARAHHHSHQPPCVWGQPSDTWDVSRQLLQPQEAIRGWVQCHGAVSPSKGPHGYDRLPWQHIQPLEPLDHGILYDLKPTREKTIWPNIAKYWWRNPPSKTMRPKQSSHVAMWPGTWQNWFYPGLGFFNKLCAFPTTRINSDHLRLM